MSFIEEYGLLIAVSLPVVVIVALQVCLFICGERGTLLLPAWTRLRVDARSGEARPAANESTHPVESEPVTEQGARAARTPARVAA